MLSACVFSHIFMVNHRNKDSFSDRSLRLISSYSAWEPERSQQSAELVLLHSCSYGRTNKRRLTVIDYRSLFNDNIARQHKNVVCPLRDAVRKKLLWRVGQKMKISLLRLHVLFIISLLNQISQLSQRHSVTLCHCVRFVSLATSERLDN